MNTTTEPSANETVTNKLTVKTSSLSNSNINAYQLVDMKYITELTGMTDKWFYSLIKNTAFPKPIKLGRSSRWKQANVEKWIEERMSS